MSPGQIKSFQAYWWPTIARHHNWPVTDRDFRLQTLSQWFRRPIYSAKDITDQKEIDLIISKYKAITRPTDLAAQEKQVGMARTRLVYRLQQLCREISPAHIQSCPLGSAYLGKIMKDRFGHWDLNRLDEKELTDMRNTLNRAVHAKRRREKQTASERAAAGREPALAIDSDDNTPF